MASPRKMDGQRCLHQRLLQRSRSIRIRFHTRCFFRLRATLEHLLHRIRHPIPRRNWHQRPPHPHRLLGLQQHWHTLHHRSRRLPRKGYLMGPQRRNARLGRLPRFPRLPKRIRQFRPRRLGRLANNIQPRSFNLRPRNHG